MAISDLPSIIQLGNKLSNSLPVDLSSVGSSLCSWTVSAKRVGEQKMKKEFNLMMIIIVCAIMGLTTAVIVYTLYTNGTIIDEMITSSVTIDDLMFIIFFAWLIIGVIVGAFKS
jgi:hypothetical protein